MASSDSQSQPPWEALLLFSQKLDPKTLAISSCVSKTWSLAMSSDHLWTPIFAAEFPSLSATISADVPRRRIYSLGRAAAAVRQRAVAPPKPRLSLSDLLFAISITTTKSNPLTLFSTIKPCNDKDVMTKAGNGVFVFDVVDENSTAVAVEEGGEVEVKVGWSVVVKGWRGVFTMMECEGKVGAAAAAGSVGWFSAELPGSGCCCAGSAAGSGVVADMKVGFAGGNGTGVRVERLCVGILNVLSWRYVTLEDGLRYLQHFLLC